jgi:hypothetical protein
VSDLTKLALSMRLTADMLEAISSQYNTIYHAPAEQQKWSAAGLRDEADKLERP